MIFDDAVLEIYVLVTYVNAKFLEIKIVLKLKENIEPRVRVMVKSILKPLNQVILCNRLNMNNSFLPELTILTKIGSDRHTIKSSFVNYYKDCGSNLQSVPS